MEKNLRISFIGTWPSKTYARGKISIRIKTLPAVQGEGGKEGRRATLVKEYNPGYSEQPLHSPQASMQICRGQPAAGSMAMTHES